MRHGARHTVKMVFEPFFTTKEPGKGTGLGLATVYGIVKQHAGHITVYSEPELGTTFRIYLPCAPEGIRPYVETVVIPDAEAFRNDVTLRGTETVLLVEDDPVIRDLASEMLDSLGYRVLEAQDSRDAVRIASGDEPIDLLLTDVVMPGMNGHEVSLEVVALRPETKVLYMSGFDYDVMVSHGAPNAPVHFLQKPFTIQRLSQKLREALESAPSAAPMLDGFQAINGGREEIAVL